MTKSVWELAQEYVKWDRSPETRQAVAAWIAEKNTPELERALLQRLTFGTAGLRAEMGPGYSRINSLTVLQASQGLAHYLLAQPEGADAIRARGVVIGHDHRGNEYAQSLELARVAAGAFLAQGIKVYFFGQLVHTPLVSYTVTLKGAACGIMVTASHNPRNDNGYKVYWANGSQIIPPHDAGIAAAIDAHLEPDVWDAALVDTSRASGLCEDPTAEALEGYLKLIRGMVHHRDDNRATAARFCYTAMHGVGWPFAQRAFSEAELPPLVPTARQIEPDPAFPTVAFPNPEEGRGALALAIEAADAAGCGVILANDPDADRLAVAERQADGNWRVFTGNELGTILGHSAIAAALKNGARPSELAVVNSAVSSKMLQAIARAEGVRHEEVLTGFKWIGNRVAALERDEGLRVVFAYEEAIGFMCNSAVRDKDGVSALVAVGELVVQLALQSSPRANTLAGYLDELAQRYGYFSSCNSYVIARDPVAVNSAFERIRFGASPMRIGSGPLARFRYALQFPKQIGGFAVASVRDLTLGYDSGFDDLQPRLPVSASSQMVTFRLVDGSGADVGAVTLRTSGTEPKLKYYVELCGSSMVVAEQRVQQVVSAVRDELLCCKRFKFELPSSG